MSNLLQEDFNEHVVRTLTALEARIAKLESHDPAVLPHQETAPLTAIKEAYERMYGMLQRVEWVRQSAGNKYACPFCHGISYRDGGPGHQEDCEWLLVMAGLPVNAALASPLAGGRRDERTRSGFGAQGHTS